MRPNYHNPQLLEFHEKFNHPIAWHPTAGSAELRLLRSRLILEEALEFVEAAGFDVTMRAPEAGGSPTLDLIPHGRDPDLVAMADGLADLRYVTEGAAVVHGIPLGRCFREVHRSNMSKLGPDGRPVYRADGKILKGPDFTPPRLDLILDLYKEMP